MLIVWISMQPQLWIPIASYHTEDDCYAALEQWELDTPGRASCVHGVVERSGNHRRKRQHK